MEEVIFNSGSEKILPAASLTTNGLNGCVKLRIPENGKAAESLEPISVPRILHDTVQKAGKKTAYIFKNDNGAKVSVNYEVFLKQIRTCAKAFLSLGLEKYHSVCIIGFNSPEWYISFHAAIYAGSVAAGIYTTNSSEACYHCASIANANIIVVEDEIQLEKIQAIRHRLTKLKAVIQYKNKVKRSDVYSWQKLMELGEQEKDKILEKCTKEIVINECCALVFTSGTVGNPKAVMLSHDNLTYECRIIHERVQMIYGEDIIVSFLPLSHVAALTIDFILIPAYAGTIYFADKDALKGSLVKTLLEARPTKFLAVPRVYEKIHEKLMEVGAQSGFLKKSIANWAKQHALQHHMDHINGNKSNHLGYRLASNLILNKIKAALGLDQCKLFVSAAAPLSSELKAYFLSLDIPIMDAFGMSECTGGHCVGILDDFNLESVSRNFLGTKTKVLNPDSEGSGEICIYGRHVFMGYLNEPEKTEETVDSEGWLHSGDLGKIDNKGFIYITGRVKELIITAGGENIPPVRIEQIVINELPVISNAMLIGDKRKFLSLLITLKTEIDPETQKPLDILTGPVQAWLKKLQCPASTVSEVLRAGPDQKLLDAIQEGINKVNEQAISNAQKIQKFKILPADFSLLTGEFGPTLKLKRQVILEKYKDIIDSMYL